MIEIKYTKFTVLDTEGKTQRTGFGVTIANLDKNAPLVCAFPFTSFKQLKKSINADNPGRILDVLEEFDLGEDAESHGLVTLNGDYVEFPNFSEEEEL